VNLRKRQEFAMALATTDGVKRPEAKTRIFGVRVTDREHAELETLAWASGKTLSEWARDMLLERNSALPRLNIHHELFTEMVGLQMLLMGCFSPLLQGQRLTPEQYQEVVRAAQAGKGKRAKELLAQRMGQEEK
jgi:hypothetical protein